LVKNEAHVWFGNQDNKFKVSGDGFEPRGQDVLVGVYDDNATVDDVVDDILYIVGRRHAIDAALKL
jgi:hypothetical protein